MSSGDPAQVNALIDSVKRYKGFRQMAEYNISCLITYITPPTVGWRENVATAVESGAIQEIIDVLRAHGKSVDALISATSALTGLAVNSKNAALVAKYGGIQTALQSMLGMDGGAESKEVAGAASRLLGQVAKYNAQAILQSEGGVGAILDGLENSENKTVKATAAKVLDRIALTKAGEQEIVKNGGVEKLLRAIGPEKETHEEMLTPTFRLLERIAKDPNHMQTIRQNNGVEILVRQLEKHSDNEVVLRAGGRLLAKIAEGDLEETIRRLNAGNMSEKARELAVGLISNLALQPENIEKIIREGGIGALVKNFDKFNVATKTAAARALQRIAAKDEVHVDELIEAGAIEVLVNAIRNPEDNEELLTAATQALTEIASTSLKHAQLVDSKGGVVAVIEALKQYSTMSRFGEAANEFIAKVCGVGFDQEKVASSGAVEAVLNGMRNNPNDAELHLQGHKALLALVSYDDVNGNQAVVKKLLLANGVKVLCDSLNTHAEVVQLVKAGIALLLAVNSLDKGAKDHVVKSNGIVGIVHAIFVQYQQEFLGNSLISRDANYEQGVRKLLAILVDKKMITGLSSNMNQTNLEKIAVFSKVQTFADFLTKDKVGSALSGAMHSLASSGGGGLTPVVAFAMWAVGRSSIQCLEHLVSNKCVETTLEAIRSVSNEKASVFACLRAMLMFAASSSSKQIAAEAKCIDACVIAMRSNAQDESINTAAIDVMIALATTDDLAADVLFKGGIRQVNKMILESSSSPEFEKATERGLILADRVASVRSGSSNIKSQMVNQNSIDAATTAMSAYPKNATIEEVGGRILAKLYDLSAVEAAIEEMRKLAEELGSTKRPEKTMTKLAKAVATVGYLSLNETNVDTIQNNEGPQIVIGAIDTMSTFGSSPELELCRGNCYRALGQMGSIKPHNAKLGVNAILINALNSGELAVKEKVGVLNGIRYLANVGSTRQALVASGVIQSIVTLLANNSTDEEIVVAALTALAQLTKDKAGLQAAVKVGALQLILNLLKNNAETLTPLMAEAIMEVLANFAAQKENVEVMVNDGIIDAVSHLLDKVCGDSLKPYPKVLGSAALLLNALAYNETVATRIVSKGALAKVVQISNSSQAYLSDEKCMEAVSKLLETCSGYESLKAKVAKIPGVVELLTEAMDENGDNEQIVTNSSKVLINLLGANPESIQQMLKEIREMIKAVQKKPNPALLEKLLKAAKNLANLALIEGVFNDDTGKEVGETAMNMYETVQKKVAEGQLKNDLMATAIQILARTVASAGANIEKKRALDLLLKVLEENPNNSLVIIEALKALGNLIENDPNGLKELTGENGIKLVEKIMNTTTDDNVRIAAEHTLQQFKNAALKNPVELITDRLGAKAVMQILNAIDDPEDIKTFLQRIGQNGSGMNALMRLIGTPEFKQLNPELRNQVFEALDDMDELELNSNQVGTLFEALDYASPKEKKTILKLLSKAKFDPQVSKQLLESGNLKKLLALISGDELKKDDEALLAGLKALHKLLENDDLAEEFLQLGGPQKLVELIKTTEDQDVKEEAIRILGRGLELQGAQGLQLGPEVLPLLAGLGASMQGEERQLLNGLIDGLNELHNEEGTGLISERLGHALDRLGETENITAHTAENGKVYYYDNVTGKTTWDQPRELVQIDRELGNITKIAEKNPEIVPQVGETQLGNAVGMLQKLKGEPLKLKELIKALAALAVNEGNRNAMLKAGVLEAVIKAMQGENLDVEFLIAAVKLLNQFAKNKVYKEKICQLGGIAALIAIMIKFIDEQKLVTLCLKCLSNLAFNAKMCVDEIMAQQGPEAVKKVVNKHKQDIPILTNAMSLLSNLMFKSPKNKKAIGNLLRMEILTILRNMNEDAKLFKQTMRAVGAISWVDEHVRWFVVNGVTKTLVAGMKVHSEDVPLQKLAIDVIGNLASADEEDIRADIERGNTQSVVDYILIEGGAKKILQVVSTTLTESDQDPTLLVNGMRTLGFMASARANVAERLIAMGIVDLVITAMQKYDWDEEILEECMRLVAFLCYYDAGINQVYKSDGVRIILTQLESHAEEPEFALIGVDALKAMVQRKEALKPVTKEIVEHKGLNTILKEILANNIDSKELVRSCFFMLIPMVTFDEEVSKVVAETGMRVILKCIRSYKDDTEVLIPGFKLIGHLAFVKENLKIIVQFGGIGLLIDAVLAHPEEFDMVKQSIKTLDNVAMASSEHSKIVIEAGGKKTIEEVMAAYEGSQHEDLLSTCVTALLSLSETKEITTKPKYIYNQQNKDVEAQDPLKDYRNTLLTGTVMNVFKGKKKMEKHFKVSKDWEFLTWRNPRGGKKNEDGKIKLKDISVVQVGQRDFAPKQKKVSDAKKSFSIVGADKTHILIEANTRQDQELWVAALLAVVETAKHNPGKLK